MAKTIVEVRLLPPYWEEAKVELMKRDRIMRKLIPQFGDLRLVGRGEPFTTLARSIVGQQISVKAADSVWQRFLEVCPKCTPAQVIKAGDKLADCGLSKRKAEYILDLADHFKAKRVHCDKWDRDGRRGSYCRADPDPRHRTLDSGDVLDL
jgi:DNA-3-methyladenine glycosylase II